MRSRAALGVLIVSIGLAVLPSAWGDVRTASGLQREVSLYFNDNEQFIARDGYLTIYSYTGGTTVGISGAPRVEYRASAWLNTCDFQQNICSGSGFDWQTVDPTSLTMDPLGNSVEIDACLLPTGGGGCQTFDLTLSRPSFISPGYLCFPALICGANAWHDPATGESHASLSWSPGVFRSAYQVTGTFAGQPFPTVVNGFSDASSWQRLVLDEQIHLP
ncbi:MAG TPA: hypothetical protein VGB52_13360 [Actinomycetota bacterium]